MRHAMMAGILLGVMAMASGCGQAEPQAQPEETAVQTVPPRRGHLVVRDGKAIWMDEPLTFEDDE